MGGNRAGGSWAGGSRAGGSRAGFVPGATRGTDPWTDDNEPTHEV